MSGIGHNSAGACQIIAEAILADDHQKLFHYVQWHLSDYLTGTKGLTFEFEGAYMRFLANLYDRGKPFPDDDRFMALVMMTDVRKWRRIKAVLIGYGKILVKNDCLTNARFERERDKRAEELKKQAAATQKYWEERRRKMEIEETSTQTSAGLLPRSLPRSLPEVEEIEWKKANEINADANPPNSHTRDQRLEKKEEELCPNGHLASEAKPGEGKKLKAAEAARMAFDCYNEMARRLGLPIANVLTETRKSKIVARIKEAGGMAAFERVLANVEGSAFLQGKNDSGFRADFDFICQAKSFTRLMDGGYGNGAHAESWSKHYNGVL